MQIITIDQLLHQLTVQRYITPSPAAAFNILLSLFIILHYIYYTTYWRSIVVRTLVSAVKLFLSCAKLAAGRATSSWVASAISQLTRQTQPAVPLGSVKWVTLAI